MTIITKLNIVMNVVMVVDDSARWGILRRLLFIIMNAKRAPIAQIIEIINLQFKIKLIIPFSERIFPEIKSRLPRSTIDVAVVTENAIVQKITRYIYFLKLIVIRLVA